MKDLELHGDKIELTSWLKSKMAASTLSYQAGLKVLPKLKLHEQSHKEIFKPQLLDEPAQYTLKKFVEANKTDKSPLQCLRLVNKAHGHARAVRGLYRILLSGQDYKKHVVWLNGVPNSGKSQLIKRAFGIFASQSVSWRGEFMPVSEVNLPELVPQLVTATEFNLNTALDPKNLPTTKNLFEGEGANVRDKLYHDGSFKYKGACFMISSNYLPKASEYG